MACDVPPNDVATDHSTLDHRGRCNRSIGQVEFVLYLVEVVVL
jgi:hypothetical protein